jgi:transmembrane sensor
MTKKVKFLKNKLDREANIWFDQTNDSQPFDAFGDAENKKRIGDEIFRAIHLGIHRKRFNPFRFIAVVAAVFIFSSTLTWFIYKYREEQNKIVWSLIRSAPGHFDKIVLSDNTIVYLHPGTILKAPQEFKGHLREVQLIDGEALFEVRHDQEHPFIVVSGNLKTQVLGTSFIIKNYHQLAAIQVSVATGKVAVMNGKILLGFLTPRQQLTFNRLTSQTDFGTTSSALAENWKSGEYVLDNASMQELALALQNIYGYRVIIKTPSLQKSNITIQFNMKDSIQDILDQLKLIHQVKYNIKNKEVILMK